MPWDEWEQLKSEAVEREKNAPRASMQLNQVAPAGGGKQPDIDIRTYGVRKTADDTEVASREAMKKVSHSLDESEFTGTTLDIYGWTSGIPLYVCTVEWEQHMVSLVRQMRSLSAALRESSNGFDKADAEAEARLNAAVRDMGES